MNSTNILRSLIDTGAIDDQSADEALLVLHRKGVVNLVKHYHELNAQDMSGEPTADKYTRIVGRGKTILNLLGEGKSEVLSPIDEVSSVEEIIGG